VVPVLFPTALAKRMPYTSALQWKDVALVEVVK